LESDFFLDWSYRQLSVDHKPNGKGERDRIYRYGGVVHPSVF